MGQRVRPSLEHRWAQNIAFYRELDELGWRQGPMLEFVSWLVASPHSRILVPDTSLTALGLARVGTFRGDPMVWIEYSEPKGFVIHWHRGLGDGVLELKEPVPSPQAPEVFERILVWLGAGSPKQAEPGVAADGGA